MEQTARERLARVRALNYRWRLDPVRAAFWYGLATAAVWLGMGDAWEIPPFTSFYGIRYITYAPLVVHLYWLALGLLCAAVIGLPPGLYWAWRRSYARLSRLLHQTSCGQVVLRSEFWHEVGGSPATLPWLKFRSLGASQSFATLLEFAACHWRTLQAFEQQGRGLAQAQLIDGLSWLCDPPLKLAIGYWGVGAMAVAVLFFLLWFWSGWVAVCFAGYVLLLPLVLWHTQNRAAQVALIDFLLE